MMKHRHYIDKFLEWTLIVLMAFNVLNVLWQVFTRFILKNPSSYTEELARYLLVWVGMLGASYAAGKKLHLAIDILSAKLQRISRIYLEMFIQICVLFFAVAVMTIGGVRLVTITLKLNQISAALRVPLGYVYLVLPVSGLLITYYSVLNIIEQFRELFSATPQNNLNS